MNMFIISRKGGVHLVHNNFVYRSNLKRQGRDLNKIYWECIYNRSTKCRGRIKSIGDQLYVTNGTCAFHNLKFNFPHCITLCSYICFLSTWIVHKHHTICSTMLNAIRLMNLLICFFFVFLFSFILSRLPSSIVEHNHLEDTSRVEAAQQSNCLIFKRISTIGMKSEEKQAEYNFVYTDFKDDTDQDILM